MGTGAPEQMRCFEIRGLTLCLPTAMVRSGLERALSSGMYEGREADAILAHLQPGDRFLDIGSGLGFLCALAAGVLGDQAVCGIEPNPRIMPLARRFLAANGFGGVRLIRAAVVATAEGDEVDFVQRPAFRASALRGAESLPENARVIRVPVWSVARLIEAASPTVICCDIEGAELEVLGEPLPGVRLIVVEMHPGLYGPAGVELITETLAAQGFEPEPKGAAGQTRVFRRAIGP